MRGFSQPTHAQIKPDASIATTVDTASEKFIVEQLKRHTPDFGVLSEESHAVYIPSNEYTWIVDPLDGSSNYYKSIPLFAVQIALLHKGEIVLGVISLPYERLLLSAVKGSGLRVNGIPFMLPITNLPHSLLLFESYLDNTDIRILHAFRSEIDNIRIINSACTSMAYLALGRANVVIDRVDKPWDLAAGSLLVQESGGTVTNLQGDVFDPLRPECIATKQYEHNQAVNLVKECI